MALPDGDICELGGGEDTTTNNRMELTATLYALRQIRDVKLGVDVYTDSVYVIRGITQWIWGWRKRQWKTAEGEDVANRDLWESLASLVSAREGFGKINWHFIRGHSGNPGNERVDEIAVAYSKGKRPGLFHGKLLEYSVAIHDLPEDTSLPEPKDPKDRVKLKAFSYLSLVDGVARRHSNWPDCERAVKGRSGAKFKKSKDEADEGAILKSWGINKNDLK